jgi:putative PIN family toxin of toxin-antitoxin system
MAKTVRVVIDTNVLVAALLRREGHNRDALRACFEDRLTALVGQALFLDYEDVLGRQQLFRKSPLNVPERCRLLESFLSVCEWVQVYGLWRPNLRDEDANHILELAIVGAASLIVTNNVSDFGASDLRFPVRIRRPKNLLKELP